MEKNEVKIRLPNKDEVFGIVEEHVGGDRIKIRCEDGNVRICRIPGRFRKRIWINIGDLVLVKKWKIGGDKRGDIVERYTPTQYATLKKKGYIKNL